MVKLDGPTEAALASRLQVLGHFGSWVWEPGTNLMRWSDALYRLHGLEPSAGVMTIESHQALLHPDDREHVTATLRHALAERVPFCVSHRVARPDGGWSWLECHGEIAGDDGLGTLRVIAFCQDVTHHRTVVAELATTNRALEQANEELQVQAEELTAQAAELQGQADTLAAQERRLQAQVARLEEVDRFKDEFLAILSHELRTPLNFVLGFSTILEDGLNGPLNPAQQESVGRIVVGTERMMRLVEDLLEIARIRAGKVAIAPQLESVAPIVADIVATLAGMAEARGLALHADVAPALTGFFDASRLAQILTNLIGNALKFTPAGGRVTISAAAAGDMVRWEVTDTGPGIPPEAAERIFQKFEQLDMSPTRPNGGVGLGLAIAQGLVEAHGGRIGVTSRPGCGSTFWFTLPEGHRGTQP